VHRDEVARASSGCGSRRLQQKALEDYGVESESLVGEYGPHQLVPRLPAGARTRSARSSRTPTPFVRAEQEKRMRGAERALALLGRVNPLALEEFQALEERHQFLPSSSRTSRPPAAT
jgi:chromosome segregation protein